MSQNERQLVDQVKAMKSEITALEQRSRRGAGNGGGGGGSGGGGGTTTTRHKQSAATSIGEMATAVGNVAAAFGTYTAQLVSSATSSSSSSSNSSSSSIVSLTQIEARAERNGKEFDIKMKQLDALKQRLGDRLPDAIYNSHLNDLVSKYYS